MIWVTSDLHFCHNREFLFKPRGFETIEEMNTAVVENWNKVVGAEDDVYVLGDIMLNDDATGLALLRKLTGHIHIVLGNHDTSSRTPLYYTCKNVIEIKEAIYLKYKKYYFFLCHYPVLCANYDADKPMQSKTISLCGHSHTIDPFVDWDKGLIYHCELDAHSCTPVPLDMIIKECQNHYNIECR